MRDYEAGEHRRPAEPYTPGTAYAVIGGALAVLAVLALLVVIV